MSRDLDRHLKKLEKLLADRKPAQDAIILHFFDDPPLPENPKGSKIGPLGPDQIIINFHRKRPEVLGGGE